MAPPIPTTTPITVLFVLADMPPPVVSLPLASPAALVPEGSGKVDVDSTIEVIIWPSTVRVTVGRTTVMLGVMLAEDDFSSTEADVELLSAAEVVEVSNVVEVTGVVLAGVALGGVVVGVGLAEGVGLTEGVVVTSGVADGVSLVVDSIAGVEDSMTSGTLAVSETLVSAWRRTTSLSVSSNHPA